MRRSLLVPATAAAALALVVPARAGAPAAQLTDQLGDANGANSQSIGLPVPGQSTSPASYGAADIVSVKLATVFKQVGRKKVPNGFTVTLQLSDAPATGVTYIVNAQVPSTCDGTNTSLSLNYLTYSAFGTSYADCQDSSDVSGASTTAMQLQVATDAAKHTITWTLDKLPKVGAKVTEVSANTSVFVVGVFDEAAGTGTFTYGK